MKELALKWGVPETTLRLLREEFADVIPVVGEGRRRRYTEEGAAVLKQIVAWRQEGWSSVKIRTELHRTRQPQAGVVRRASEEHQQEMLARLAAQSTEITLLKVEVSALRSEIARLVETLRPAASATVQSLLEASE